MGDYITLIEKVNTNSEIDTYFGVLEDSVPSVIWETFKINLNNDIDINNIKRIIAEYGSFLFRLDTLKGKSTPELDKLNELLIDIKKSFDRIPDSSSKIS